MNRKFIILIGDGMADWPIPSLGGRTPLEAANKPHMDFMASRGALGMVQVVPKEMYPGSDVSNLSIIGYDPREVYTGRSPLEAASMGVDLGQDDVAVRCNIVCLKNDGADTEMADYSAGHITTPEAAELLEALQKQVNDRGCGVCEGSAIPSLVDTVGRGAKDSGVRFYPGVSYRHLMVWPGGYDALKTTPPHDIHGKKITDYLPKGEGAEFLLELMEISREIFPDHSVNRKRIEAGKPPGNAIWLWGQGKAPRMETFQEKYGLKGSVVAAVDLIRGIGVYAGLETVTVPGATGYIDTNFRGKAEYALRELDSKDFVLIHVEAPDEAGHNGSVPDKIRAIERIDEEMVGPILARARDKGDLTVLVLPDHPTPVAIRTHSQEPVPFIFYPAPPGLSSFHGKRYTEADAKETGQFLDAGTRLIDYLLAEKDA
ncbi:MAG TPA: cofactor-independent phosphoglycerate mutase [Candidatus Limnocylindria bacterium]|nr:cofactor-independent phosphoglycerate mutase [Candidatus Limnocylindria bacterium]